MARQNRKFTPRQRTTRPLGVSLTSNQPPVQPLQPPSYRNGDWFIDPPLASRLYQKSGIGKMQSDESILLTAEEIMFCHWHRHVPLPHDTWFEEYVTNDPDFIARSIVFDTARSGGEILIPVENVSEKWGVEILESTWALRWNREHTFSKQPPVAHVRWAWTTDRIDWAEMLHWTREVHSHGMLAEFFVIDEEMDVTMYLLDIDQPSGQQALWQSFSSQEKQHLEGLWNQRIGRGTGWFIPNVSDWPWESIGVEHLSGRHLRQEEGELLHLLFNNLDIPSELQLYSDLMSRGVLLRPGFKFGSKWRVYETSVGDAHAPWLVQPVELAPHTWEGACLAVRLSEGVNKTWLCALHSDDEWHYLHMQRWLPGRN
tara:strand:- start:20325 stop:21437 length:1113 start_codon:yes stop_codon:yes gene_type:complete